MILLIYNAQNIATPITIMSTQGQPPATLPTTSTSVENQQRAASTVRPFKARRRWAFRVDFEKRFALAASLFAFLLSAYNFLDSKLLNQHRLSVFVADASVVSDSIQCDFLFTNSGKYDEVIYRIYSTYHLIPTKDTTSTSVSDRSTHDFSPVIIPPNKSLVIHRAFSIPKGFLESIMLNSAKTQNAKIHYKCEVSADVYVTNEKGELPPLGVPGKELFLCELNVSPMKSGVKYFNYGAFLHPIQNKNIQFFK